ncbi:MAG: cyclically-permuted mutarotase family protein, partial [bacterium]
MTTVLSWSQLPDLPPAPGKDSQPGVAGAFVGVSNGVLLIAGGANFPEKPVWEKGVKVYYDDIFVLEKTANGSLKWHMGFKLPRPLAYGVAITTEHGVVCIGGEDGQQSYADVFLMTWNPRTKQVEFESLPALPQPVSSMAGAKINKTIYIAGGQENGQASNRFRGLDLSRRKDDEFAWEDQPDFPGPPRIQPVAA